MGCTRYIAVFFAATFTWIVSFPSLAKQDWKQAYADATVRIKASSAKVLSGGNSNSNNNATATAEVNSARSKSSQEETIFPTGEHSLNKEDTSSKQKGNWSAGSLTSSTASKEQEGQSISSLLEKIPQGMFKEDAVIIFFDLPRAGALNLVTQVQKNVSGSIFFQSAPGKKRNTWDNIVTKANAWVSVPPSKRKKHKGYFVDINKKAPSFLEVQNQLRDWRAAATEAGIPFFVFTVMRDSLSLALEHFNTQHRNKRAKKIPNLAPNDQTFLKMAQHDPLCSFYAYSYQYPLQPSERDIPTKETCDAVLQGLHEHMDWIGTAENHQDTMQIMKHLLGMPAKREILPDKSFKVGLKTLTMDKMKRETIERYEDMTRFDSEVYQAARNWRLRLPGMA